MIAIILGALGASMLLFLLSAHLGCWWGDHA